MAGIDLAVVFVLGCVAASAWFLLTSREVQHRVDQRIEAQNDMYDTLHSERPESHVYQTVASSWLDMPRQTRRRR